MKKHSLPVPPDKDNSLPDSLQYPPEDDIYSKGKRVKGIETDDNTLITSGTEKPDSMNEKDFEDDMSGGDLDIPGSELDDSSEAIGEEDEENNHYSLGGDNHDNLEEAKE